MLNCSKNNYERPKLPKIIRLKKRCEFKNPKLLELINQKNQERRGEKMEKRNQTIGLKNIKTQLELYFNVLEVCETYSTELEILVLEIIKINPLFQRETDKTKKFFTEMTCEFKKNIEKLLKQQKTGEMEIAIDNFCNKSENIIYILKKIWIGLRKSRFDE